MVNTQYTVKNDKFFVGSNFFLEEVSSQAKDDCNNCPSDKKVYKNYIYVVIVTQSILSELMYHNQLFYQKR